MQDTLVKQELVIGEALPSMTFDILNTEVGNARRLIASFGSELRFCPELDSWLTWTGTHWEPEKEDKAIRPQALMKKVVQEMRNDALATLEEIAELFTKIEDRMCKDGSKKIGAVLDASEAELLRRKTIASDLLDWARQSEKSANVKASVFQARSEGGVAVRVNQLNTNRLLFNCLSGTVDLRTGRLLDHNRADLITKIAPVSYEPFSTCPKFEAFMDSTFPNDPDTIRFLQRFFGYCLSGESTERILLFFIGTGANGKSVLCDIMQGILGQAGGYAMTTGFSTFLQARECKPDATRNDLVRMEGARLVTASESNDRAKLDTAVLKQLTGDDDIVCRANYLSERQFRPQAKLILRTNHKPRVDDDSDGYWERARYVPFMVTIPPERQIKGLTKMLLAEEGPGILNWMMQGWEEVWEAWQTNQPALLSPKAVVAASADYREEQNQVARFVLEKCRIVDRETEGILSAPLYKVYSDWCDAQGEYSKKTQTGFSLALEAYGKDRRITKRKDSDGCTRWFGLLIADDGRLL